MANQPLVIPSDLVVRGTLTAASMTVPSNAIGDAQVKASDPIGGTKLQCRKAVTHRQAAGADVASATEHVFIASADGVLQSADVFIATAPTGTSGKQFTVDVQKSTGGGAFASVLSAVVTIDSGKTDRSVTSGTITDDDFVAGDVFAVIVTASGSTGTQGQGLNVTLNMDENPA